MLLPRPFVHYLAKELTRRLGKDFCEIPNPGAVADALEKIIIEDLAIEEEINAEARELLNQYADYMRANSITYSEMFRRVKKQILDERKVLSAASRDGKTKISREKINEISHQIAEKLPRLPGVRILKGWNDARLEVVRELTAILQMEQKVDDKARAMIERQTRRIVEGSEEWQVLHHRYYEQEMSKLGVDLRMPETPHA